MAVKRAKIIESKDLKVIFKLIDATKDHSKNYRDKVAVLLSVKAGLRAAEIAGIRWIDVTKADGTIADVMHIGSHITKGKKRDRQVPIHPELKRYLELLKKQRPDDEFIRFGDYKETMTANAMTVWFSRLYQAAGLGGCSSHSGRRTFITEAARRANLFNASLRDVQDLAGHANLTTTERYIDPSDGVKNLVSSL
jgi:integrase/recombinase XerD